MAEEPPIAASADNEDELTPLGPFDFVAGTHTAQEEEAIPKPSPAPVHAPDDATLVVEPEQTIQDSLAAPALDLNEDQPQEEQDVYIFFAL